MSLYFIGTLNAPSFIGQGNYSFVHDKSISLVSLITPCNTSEAPLKIIISFKSKLELFKLSIICTLFIIKRKNYFFFLIALTSLASSSIINVSSNTILSIKLPIINFAKKATKLILINANELSVI